MNFWNLRSTFRSQLWPSPWNISITEIKPCGRGSRIWDVEAFWHKREIKIINFVLLWVLVWFTLALNFWYLKLKGGLRGMRMIFLIACYQNNCKKFIEIKSYGGCMVWAWWWLFQHPNYTLRFNRIISNQISASRIIMFRSIKKVLSSMEGYLLLRSIWITSS